MAEVTPSYDDLINSPSFKSDLASLNQALLGSLKQFGAPQFLNGNLFYEHRSEGFADAPLSPDMDEKRRRLFEIARRGKSLLEIGVNGGHSLLLAKLANPALKCTGIDICKQISPNWGRVDVYTPRAMQWLKTRFPGDFVFHMGDSLLEAPRFAVTNPEAQIDILHVDGDKQTYFRDIVNLMPVLHKESLIVVDDTNLRTVQGMVKSLIAAGLVEVHPDYTDASTQRYQHMILRLKM